MAREFIGLSAKVEIDSKDAISALGRTGGAFKAMRKNAKSVRAGMANIRKGFAGSRIAAVALTAGLVKAAKDFAGFNFELTRAKSLTRGTKQDMKDLTVFAKKMGATTFFTATQAAKAMQSLARGGLNAKEIMAALPAVLSLAAAESIDLAAAAKIVINTSNMFGISMKKAGTIADTLAFVSKRTATDINGLAEGLKFAGTKSARSLNISLKQTVGVLGLLANVARSSSKGGTALNNALIKISKNSKSGKLRLGKFRATIAKTFDKKTGKRGINLVQTMRNIAATALKIKSPLKRSAALTKLLGIRGEATALAFIAAFGPKNRKKTNSFLKDLNGNLQGTSKRLAQAQIKTAAGQFKILTSSLAAASVEIGGLIVPALIPFVKGATAVIGQAAKAIQVFGKGTATTGEQIAKQSLALVGVGETAREIGRGVVGAFEAVKEVGGKALATIKSIGSAFGLSFGGSKISNLIITTAKTLAWVAVLKTAGGAMFKLGRIAVGTFQIIKGGLGIAAAGTVGLLKKLGVATPLVGRFASKLPGIASGLGKAFGALDKLTAQPVRVVNFDEMALAQKVGGGQTGPMQAAGAAGAATVAGIAAILVAGVVGVFEKSSAIDKALAKEKAEQRSIREARRKRAADKISLVRRAGVLAKSGAAGKRKFTSESGTTQALTQANVLNALREKASKENKLFAFASALPHLLKSIRSLPVGEFKKEKPPTAKEVADATAKAVKDALAALPFKFEINLDGKTVARVTGKKKEEQNQRLGTKNVPGSKRKNSVQ